MCQSPIWIRNRAYSSRTIGLTDRKVLLMNRPWDYFTSSVFLPRGCYYLSDKKLHLFVEALFSGTLFYDMKLLPASSQSQGLILLKVDEKSFYRYEQEEED